MEEHGLLVGEGPRIGTPCCVDRTLVDLLLEQRCGLDLGRVLGEVLECPLCLLERPEVLWLRVAIPHIHQHIRVRHRRCGHAIEAVEPADALLEELSDDHLPQERSRLVDPLSPIITPSI